MRPRGRVTAVLPLNRVASRHFGDEKSAAGAFSGRTNSMLPVIEGFIDEDVFIVGHGIHIVIGFPARRLGAGVWWGTGGALR